MSLYQQHELQQGVGAFDHAMRNQSTLPGFCGKMSAGVAIGLLLAMMRSGLPHRKIEEVIDREFATSSHYLRQILTMYEGDSWDIHLWHRQPNGQYKLCTDLCQKGRPEWRFDPSLQADF